MKYNKDMPGKLIKVMTRCHSFSGACSELGVSPKTGYEWVKKYKAFSAAKDLGDSYALNFLERIAMSCLLGTAPKGMDGKPISKKINTTMCIFLLKTRWHSIYGEKAKTDNDDEDKSKTFTMNYRKPGKKGQKK